MSLSESNLTHFTTIKEHLYNSFVINLATERCPVLSDILMLCMSASSAQLREQVCKIHRNRLDDCLDHEMKIEYVSSYLK